jgi:hypothetical protein
MRVILVTEIPHGGDVYIHRSPGSEAIVYLDAGVYSQEDAERLARKVDPGQGIG